MARKDIPAISKICIVGFADGHRDLAPWDDNTMEFWGLNRLHMVLQNRVPKFDRWFELHSLQKFYLDNNDTVHAAFLHDFKGPVYIRPNDADLMDIPAAVPYPIEKIMGMFGGYFTNSVSWILALAIMELAPAAAAFQADPKNVEAPELHVFGVDMAQDTLQTAEYGEQRPSCEYFLGWATAMGILITLPEGSDLLKASHLYGFDDTDPMRGKHQARLVELAGRRAAMQAQLDQGDAERAKLVAGVNQLQGAEQDEQYWLRNLMPSEEVAPSDDKPEITLEVLAGGLANVQQTLAAMTADTKED